MTPRVHLLGHVEADDLPRWYNAADVATMPNREINGDTEGFGMVFIEAAACGKPTVAGLAGGTGAAVIDGVTGLRVDGASTQAVADALYRLLSDPLLAKELGKQRARTSRPQLLMGARGRADAKRLASAVSVGARRRDSSAPDLVRGNSSRHRAPRSASLDQSPIGGIDVRWADNSLATCGASSRRAVEPSSRVQRRRAEPDRSFRHSGSSMTLKSA